MKLWQPRTRPRTAVVGEQVGLISLAVAPAKIRLLVMLATAAGLWPLYAAILASAMRFEDLLVASISGGVAATASALIAAWLALKLPATRLLWTSAVVAVVVLGLASVVGVPVGPQVVSALYCLTVVYRMARLVHTESLAAEGRSQLVIDSLALALATVLIWLTDLGGVTPAMASLRTLVGVVFLLYLLGRFSSQWIVERVETGTSHAGVSGLVILLTVAVLLAVYGPWLFYHALILVTLGFAYLIAPVIIALFDPFMKAIHREARKHPARTPPHHQGTSALPQTMSHLHAPAPWISDLVEVVLLVIIVSALFSWMLRWRRGSQGALRSEAAEIVVRRRKVANALGVRFCDSAHPIRQQFQVWQQQVLSAEKHWHPSDTPRTLGARRVADLDAGSDLIARYEQVRYGGSEGAADRQPSGGENGENALS